MTEPMFFLLDISNVLTLNLSTTQWWAKFLRDVFKPRLRDLSRDTDFQLS